MNIMRARSQASKSIECMIKYKGVARPALNARISALPASVAF